MAREDRQAVQAGGDGARRADRLPRPVKGARRSKAAGACEFLFAGAAILPAFLAYAEMPALAAIAFVVLVIAGAVCGIADPQAPHREATPPPPRAGSGD